MRITGQRDSRGGIINGKRTKGTEKLREVEIQTQIAAIEQAFGGMAAENHEW
jgi:hypothetical protein